MLCDMGGRVEPCSDVVGEWSLYFLSLDDVEEEARCRNVMVTMRKVQRSLQLGLLQRAEARLVL